EDVFLNCQMIRRNKVYLHCSGLDRLGNASNQNLLVHGSFDFTDQKIDQVIDSPFLFEVKQARDFMRFHYYYRGKNYQTNALTPHHYPIYFGDLHTHSSYSDARLPILPEGLFDYAKNISALDFMAITDHSEAVFGKSLTKAQWSSTIMQVKNANLNDQFSAFLGFEWTSTFLHPKSPWGHRTIIYPSYQGLPYRSDLVQYSTPEKLYAVTGSVFSFPHHSMIEWGSFDYKLGLQKNERAFEVFSSHGSSEDDHSKINPKFDLGSLHHAIQNTKAKFSILASSDNHAGHPGLNDWYGLIQPSMLDGGGLTAVFSSQNTKQSIYKSLMQGKFYGTSGTRILLLPDSLNHPFPIRIFGSSELSHLKIISFDQKGKTHKVQIKLSGLEAHVDPKNHGLQSGQKYYVQINQKDQERAWIGPYTYP
ncbi:DUF3604 domain-containing protein, partial [bacterium]|nr:DUF3604 domain-containing protein [bacterium]